MNNLALVFERQDKLGEARQLHEETLQLRRRLFGMEHPDTLQSMMNLATVLRDQGQLEEARKLFEETLILDRRIRRPDYPARITLMGSLASVLGRLGHQKEARKLYEETLALSRGVYGPEHPDTLLTGNSLAWLLATTPNPQLRDPPRAVELAKETVKHMPMDPNKWNTLGVSYYAAGDWQNAITALEKSEELAPGKLVAENGFFLAMAHGQLGEPGVRSHGSGIREPLGTAEEQARHRGEARQWYNKAIQWMQKNQPTDPELLQFRAEASKLLGLPDTQTAGKKDGK